MKTIPLGTLFEKFNGDIYVYVGFFKERGQTHHCFRKALTGIAHDSPASIVVFRHECKARFKPNPFEDVFPRIGE